jgi:restriction system protein
MKKQTRGPKFVTYFGPVLDALRDLGSSARPREVVDWIANHVEVPKSEIEGINKSGQSKFENMVAWARFYLTKAGLIDGQQRGVWVLTEAGRDAKLSHDQALHLFQEIHDRFQSEIESEEGERKDEPQDVVTDEVSAPGESEYVNENQIKQILRKILSDLSDKGFEELSALLLRKVGFENVTIKGMIGDKGVDGEGYLFINRFVRTKVMFQCKRYEGSVGPDKIRDFRGAIQGRVERGIFLTTGSFTRGATTEANRENATPIELVDIDRLLDLMVEQGLGVRESKALVIETEFFKAYQNPKRS